MATCKGCGAEIQWIQAENGRAMPVDVNRTTVVTKSGKIVHGYVSHWAKCPKAERFREEKKFP